MKFFIYAFAIWLLGIVTGIAIMKSGVILPMIGSTFIIIFLFVLYIRTE